MYIQYDTNTQIYKKQLRMRRVVKLWTIFTWLFILFCTFYIIDDECVLFNDQHISIRKPTAENVKNNMHLRLHRKSVCHFRITMSFE